MLVWATYNFPPPARLLRTARLFYWRNESHIANKRYVTIIDYTKPVLVKRLWVVEFNTGKVIFSSHVSHAYASGLLYATKLSNAEDSEKSCNGSFVTRSTYVGRWGYALRVQGLESGNSNTLRRDIVFHACPLPVWSKGCWMTTSATNRTLINLIKGGSFVYVTI